MNIEREIVEYVSLNRKTGNYDRKKVIKYRANGRQFDKLKDAKKALSKIPPSLNVA